MVKVGRLRPEGVKENTTAALNDSCRDTGRQDAGSVSQRADGVDDGRAGGERQETENGRHGRFR